MAITIRFQGGKLAGKVISFDDNVETIRIGRNPERCQVVFPPDETRVGREHCALQRVLGRYRIILNGEDRVSVNGKEAYHEQELPIAADLRLGTQGPQIVATTSDASGLPPTLVRGVHRPGLGTELSSTRRRSNRGIHIAVLALMTLGVASAIGYHLHHQTAEAVNTNGDELNKTLDELRKTAPDLAEHLQAAAPSVYLILIKNALGEFSDGTAWVIADGTLATNSHVAQTFLTGLGPGEKMIARSCANPPVDFEVTSVLQHPGYHRFDEVVVDRAPGMPGTNGNDELLSLIPACDVALLKVAHSDGLAPPLQLATDEQVQGLKSGDAIGMVGYPSENILGHNTANPQPSVQVGRIARVTDFLMRADGGAQELQLVHHSIPATGGASGSPILNQEGLVVAINNAGNLLSVNGTRIPIAVGLNFGQRADLIRELLEQRADADEGAREAHWQAELGNFTIIGDEDGLLSDAVQAWIDKTPGSRAVEIGRQRLVLKTISFGGKHFADCQFPVTAGTAYLFHFFTLGRVPVIYRLFDSPYSTDSQQSVSDLSRGKFEYLPPEDGTVRISLESDEDTAATADLVAYRLDTSPATATSAP